VISGHDEPSFVDTVGALKPDGVTVVVLMGFARRARLATRLVEAGWNPTTPVAIVADGTLANERTWRGVLSDVAGGAQTIETDGPAIIVVGAVAALELNGTALNRLGLVPAVASVAVER
jgi:siroheme synthase